MICDLSVRIEELPSWWRELFRPRENDRKSNLSVIPGPITFHTGPFLFPKKADNYERKLEKLSKYAAQRHRNMARPLRHLVTRRYAGRSGLALMDLPVRAIKGVNPALGTKLQQHNITTVDHLAKASTKKLNRIEKSGILTLAQSYAKDIKKHATIPRITEHPLPIKEILKSKFAGTTKKDLLGLKLDVLNGIGKLTAKKIMLAGVASNLGDLQGVSYDELVAAGANSHEAFLMTDYSAMLREWAIPLGEAPALGTLRFLMFDGQLELRQSIPIGDPKYPLDKPNIDREPEDIGAEPYVGYIIAADEIVIAEDITTDGNDLVLIAKKIQVGKTGAITINTTPTDFADAANVEEDGLDADNGGDLVFVCVEHTVESGSEFRTTGGAGQKGGAGKPMTKPGFLEENVHFEKPRQSGSMRGIFWGMLFSGHCKFHVDPDDWPSTWNWRVISYEDYHKKIFGTAVNVTGEWTLWNGIDSGAPRYLTFVDIPDAWYPTAGRSGGYGGNPGKMSLVMPDPSVANGIDSLLIEAETGTNGDPGLGGQGGDCTPDDIRSGGYLKSTSDYLEENTIDKAEHTYRGEPDQPFVGGWDRFNQLKGERLDSIAVADKLEDSICGATFGADLLVLYPPNPERKRTGALKETFVWGGSPWPLSIWVSAVNSGSQGSFLNNQRIDNRIATPTLDSMGLNLDRGLRGEPKPVMPTETESLKKLGKNWYQTVYEIIPEYPLNQYKQADRAYRQGKLDIAAAFYDVVLSFACEVPDFESDQAAVVSDAGYRMDRIAEGYDYFGFKPDTIIPTSPTRDYFPLPLTTAYSDTVVFYNEAIRGVHDSIETIEMGKDIIRQFRVKHDMSVEDMQESLAILDMEMAILESEIDAMENEINALHWSNQRLGGLLQRWAQRVDDKIKELEKQKEDSGPGWWEAVIAVWNVIKLVASIIAACFGFVTALAATIDALQKLEGLMDSINDLRIACGELVSNLDDWSWEQIGDYLDAMGEVTKEIESWFNDAKQAWKEAESKIQDVKKTFEETQSKFDELSAVDMSETEATEFQNNVLLADEIGVSGAMNYLQIQEQIYLNNDLLSARYSSLQALTETRVKLAYQALSIMRQLAAHKAEARYLDELLDAYTWNIEQKQAALQHLTKIGQHSLDALMHRLARQNRQLKYLKLDKLISSENYAYFIEEEENVGAVLQAKDRLIAEMQSWIENNNNIGRLKVVVTDDPDYAGNPGGITIEAPEALTRFSRGRYVRPSLIMEIEPLRETVLVELMSKGIANRRSDPEELARLLISQFLIKDGDSFSLIEPDVLGFDVTPEIVEIILSRERIHHPLLDSTAAGELDDTSLVLAYALAKGGVTLQELTDLLQQTAIVIPPLLKSRIESLKRAWVAISNDINAEQVVSLRSLSAAVRQAADNPEQLRTILDEAFIEGGQFVWLGSFHLDQQDIQSEIANSYDSDMEEALLSRVYSGEPGHVVVAVVLLYAGMGATAVESLSGVYVTEPNPLGECITDVLLPEWENLRTTLLETKHDIEIRILLDKYMQIPNAAEMFREMRYLSARAVIPTDISLLLEKMPIELYARKTAPDTTVEVEFTFESADDVVTREQITTPPGLNIEDVHFTDLFGRSILGKWVLSFNYKGNRPPLPDLNLVELEFLHTYVEQS